MSLTRFDHPPGSRLPTAFSAHEAAQEFHVNIIERGAFRLRYGRRREWTLGAGAMFLSRPGEVYGYSHIEHVEPDACLRVEFSAPAESELADIFRGLPLVLSDTNHLAFLRLQLCSFTSEGMEMSLDALACELVDAAHDSTAGCCHLYRPTQLRWYAQRIGAARELMNADPAAQHSLRRLASEVAMSPFLFARVFRELTGMPPHKYLVRLRLQRARELLRRGMPVTDACYAAGFNSLSHFTRTFRRTFGVVPSELTARSRR